MAKINHNNSLDTIDQLLTDAKEQGIIHLISDLNELSTRKLSIHDRDFLNFGTCGYLGLELDQRLKDGAIDYTQKYGTQYGISRGYLSSGINLQLEEYLSQMFDNKQVLTYSSTSAAHISIIPTLITHEDAIILDQQVHFSVQTAAQLVRQKGVPIEMIRHSNMEMLEKQVIELSKRHKRIWYLIDGVYSMYGDLAPMDDLISLMDKYEQLYIYVDDAHGMSWHGKHGTGYINSKVSGHNKVMLMTTMGKGFGVTGGLAIFPNSEMYRKVRIFGGPLIYSHPLAPPIIGAAIASAKIHLSDEIYSIQNELRVNIDYCSQLLSQTELPIMSDPLTPIGFLGMGQPKVGYNMVKRLLNDGFFVNLALFPAVSVRNTGVRFSINRNVEKPEIKEFVNALVYHYPKALEEEGKTIDEVRKVFKLPYSSKVVGNTLYGENKSEGGFSVQEERSIKQINKTQWNSLLGANGSFDWEGLVSLEDVFSNNKLPEENWEFFYFIVTDENNKPIVATFFSSGVFKDDMLALESVSIQIEEKRKSNPYYLTSRVLMMGSMLTEGHHYYADRTNPRWKEAFKLVLEKVAKLQDNLNLNTLLLRDFDKDDIELKELFLKEGFAPIDMPNSNIVENMNWNTNDELLQTLTHNRRKHIKKEALKYEDAFEVEYKESLSQEEADYYYRLYLEVEHRNRGFNMFDYPKNILEKLSGHKNWEFIILKLKAVDGTEPKVVAVVWCYKGERHYSPMIIGMDYKYVFEHKVYKQALFQVLKRARLLNLSKVYFGLSADIEKHKYGASQFTRVAYVQAKDNYNMEVIETMAANT